MTYPEHPPVRPSVPPEPAGPPAPLPQPVPNHDAPRVPVGPPVYGPPAYGPPVYGPPVHGPAGYGYPPPAAAPRNGMGTAGMVLGIIGVVSTLGSQSSSRSFENSSSTVGYFLVPVTLGVLAVVFGSTGQARVRRGEATNSGRATTSLVLGIVTLALCAVLIAVAVSRS